MNFIDDDSVDHPEGIGGLRGQQQVERFRSRDQDVGWIAAEASSFALGSIAGTNADRRIVEGHTLAAGHVGDASQGRAKVAFHVNGEGLERRDVDDAAASAALLNILAGRRTSSLS